MTEWLERDHVDTYRLFRRTSYFDHAKSKQLTMIDRDLGKKFALPAVIVNSAKIEVNGHIGNMRRSSHILCYMLYNMKKGILLLALFIPFVSIGQSLKEAKKALKKISSLDQIDDLKDRYPNWTIYEDKTMQSDSGEFPDIINSKVGDVILKQKNPNAPTFVGKLLSEREVELCKLKYIFLDGSKLSKSQLDSLRTDILTRYNNGEDFGSLVKAYTMDGNLTGDLGWFSKGMMVEEFDNAVRNRKKGEIFEVDVTNNNWYYIVLKTHDNKMEKVKISVMIKYSI